MIIYIQYKYYEYLKYNNINEKSKNIFYYCKVEFPHAKGVKGQQSKMSYF